MSSPSSPPQKPCFITVGATASFTNLIKTSLSPEFLAALHGQNYTALTIQYGKDGKKTFDDYLWAVGGVGDVRARYGVEVSGFEFETGDGVRRLMVWARDGCCVCHAGSGTILDALRVATPILVIPNPELMDNHQVELAEVLEEQKYVVHGRLDDLGDGLRKVEDLRKGMVQWPPVTAGDKRGGLVRVVREEMGWLD